MRNIKITISYLGTDYCGWQVQPEGISVSLKIIDAIYAVTKEKVKLYGSGRTDAGVHAYAQTANFHIRNQTIPVEKFVPALNANLPKDIVVISSELMDDDFHARYDACGKTYEYKIHYSPLPSPFLTDRAWHVKTKLNIHAMKQAASDFIGTHDFFAFMASGSFVKDTVRTVSVCELEHNGTEITLTVTGNGFLYNMVRIITGTLIQIGQGKIEPDTIIKILESKDRTNAGITAPAHGLYLKEVYYESEKKR